MRKGLAGILALLLAPVATAAMVRGELDVGSSLRLPAGVTIASQPQAIYVADAAGDLELVGQASSLTVQVFEDRYLVAETPLARPMAVIGSDRPTWTLHQATVRIVAARPGWLGIHPGPGRLDEDHPYPVAVVLEANASVGTAGIGPDDAEALPYFRTTLPGPSLVREAQEWAYEGAGAIKLAGPTLELVAAENTTRIETGDLADPANPAQRIRRHVVIGSPALNLHGIADAQVASAGLEAAWDGQAEVEEARGRLSGAGREWVGAGAPAWIDGDLAAELSAWDTDTIRIVVAGDLRDASLASRVDLGPASGGPPWLLLGGIGLVAVAAATLVRRRRDRSRHAAALRADDLASLAERAADAEDFRRAAELAELARRQSPTSRRLAIDHAFYLSRVGERDRALRILAEPPVVDDPDAHLLATRLHLEAGELDAAADRLTRALARAPSLLHEVESDADYAALLARADVRAALRGARRSLE